MVGPLTYQSSHQLSGSSRNLKIGITSNVSLHRVDHKEMGFKSYDCLADTFIIQSQIPLYFLIYKSDNLPVGSNLHESGLDGILSSILRVLVDKPLRFPTSRPIRIRTSGRQFRNQVHHR